MTADDLAEEIDDLTSETDTGRRIEKGRELRRKVARLYHEALNVGTSKEQG